MFQQRPSPLPPSAHILSPRGGHQHPARASPLLTTTHHRCGSRTNCFLARRSGVNVSRAHNSAPALFLFQGRGGSHFLLFSRHFAAPRENAFLPKTNRKRKTWQRSRTVCLHSLAGGETLDERESRKLREKTRSGSCAQAGNGASSRVPAVVSFSPLFGKHLHISNKHS